MGQLYDEYLHDYKEYVRRIFVEGLLDKIKEELASETSA